MFNGGDSKQTSFTIYNSSLIIRKYVLEFNPLVFKLACVSSA